MVQLVDHPFDGGNITVLRSRVQFSFLPLFWICQISHGHVIYNLIWSRIGSTWNLVGIHLESTWNLVGLGSTWIPVNLVGMVGIWWESFPVQVKFGWVLTDMIFLPFHLDSTQNSPGSAWILWGTVKYSVPSMEKGWSFLGTCFQEPYKSRSLRWS